jgi:hypothetical protein
MTRPRSKPDGLPPRLYERKGERVYSIGYKRTDGSWAFRESCPVDDKQQIAKLRRDAIRRALNLSAPGGQVETIAQLIDAWLTFQRGLPDTSLRKRAASTLDENEREARNLKDVFGDMSVADLRPYHAYAYLDKCEELGRGPKGNKEISLLTTIYQLAVRRGLVAQNPLTDVEKLPTAPSTRYVKDQELELAVRVGRELGGASQIVALALQTAYLCVRRSVEVRDLRRTHVTPEGIKWLAGKRRAGEPERWVLIEWSPELRAVIDEALAIPRSPHALGDYIFGNLEGERYTKGGWKSNLGRLMNACTERAQDEGIKFEKFSLMDLRPKGVTDKLDASHDDVVDATLHKSDRMVRQVYDRRHTRRAKPTR